MKAFLFSLVVIFIFPLALRANGGDQRVVDGKYLINLARSPFTPRVEEKIAMLISFVDIQANKLITEDLDVKIRIAKLGGMGTEKRTFIFEKDKIEVKGGVLEFPYTFTETGLHEIFIDFAFVKDPETVYEAPDFLFDIQKAEVPQGFNPWIAAGTAAGLLVGLILGKVLWRPRRYE